MNLKKFISGVSALAIAASAFAGLAVSAGAAESATYGSDSWTINTDGTGFTGDYTDKSGTTKNAVGVKGNGGSGNRVAYFAPTQTTENKVTVDAYIVLESGNNNSSASYYKLEDQAGNVLVRLGLDGNNTTNVTLQDSTGIVAENVIPAAKAADSAIGNGSSTYGLTAWTEVKAVLYFARGTGVVTIGSTDYNITLNSASTAFKRFYLQGGRGYGASLVSGYTITEEEDSLPAGALTINYVDAEGHAIATASTPDVANYSAGDTYTYAYPKYIANGGDLYKITAEKTKASAALRAAATSVDVTYAVQAEGTYYVYEFDGGYTTRADYESNGSAATGSATLTVPADGVYTITANCYGSAGNRTATVTSGDTTLVEATAIGIYAPGTDLVKSDAVLHSGDQITVTTSDSKSGIDYVILQKTGDIPVPAPNLTAEVTNQGTENGTEEFANDSATWFIITVANTGDATGSYNTVSITDGTDTFNAEVANATLDAGASIVYGGVVEGVFDFNAASVLSAE